ncbi:hypothetical protein M3J09_011619 [Ascochyta lentis]
MSDSTRRVSKAAASRNDPPISDRDDDYVVVSSTSAIDISGNTDDERRHETAHDADEISSLSSDWVELSDGEDEFNTTSFQNVIRRLQSPPPSPKSPACSAALSPPGCPASRVPQNHPLEELSTTSHTTTLGTASDYDSDEDMETLDPRRALAAIERERPTLVAKDIGRIADRNPAPATVASIGIGLPLLAQ